jgi:hypothetical protein
MAQTNSAVATRLAYTGTTGGQRERIAKGLINQLIQFGKDAEALFPDATHASQKTTLFSDLDTVITDVHNAVALSSDVKRN